MTAPQKTDLRSEFLRELSARGYIHQCTDMDALDSKLEKGPIAAYIGFDCTADSLHVGSLVQIMLLRWLQKTGHKPIVLMGGGTSKVGDPSFKDEARKLITEEEIQHNMDGIKKVFSKYLTFGDGPTDAVMVNNADWLDNINYLEFLRDYGVHFSVNRMLSFDSVKLRLDREQSLSFLEFNYMILQAYDFLELARQHDCRLQLGGSDQWGNIVNGIELARRIDGAELFGVTTPLITKSDGSKFGKSEGGNVWLDANRTSPYKFYQYWLNSSDEDAEKYIKIFTFLTEDAINALIKEHQEAPHLRVLQKRLAKEITSMVHSVEDFKNAEKASNILFSKSFKDDIKTLDEATFLDVFEGVSQANISKSDIDEGLDMIGALAAKTNFLASNGEARRALKENSVSVNKEKVKEDYKITASDLINDTYVILNKGKRNTYILKVV